MKSTIEMVTEFHRAFRLPSPAAPSLTPLGVEERKEVMELARLLKLVAGAAHKLAAARKSGALLRVQLMAEELGEVVEAIGEGDPAYLLHELADLRVVADGTAVHYGLADVLEPAVAEIHRANMSKLDDFGNPILNEAGRVVKGPNFKKADVSRLL